jgi:hypothetical protein
MKYAVMRHAVFVRAFAHGVSYHLVGVEVIYYKQCDNGVEVISSRYFGEYWE